MARSDWKCAAPGLWQRNDAAVIAVRVDDIPALHPMWEVRSHVFSLPGSVAFSHLADAMDYADTHYPMEREG